MLEKKIAAMHREYGTLSGVKCQNCPHLDAYMNADCTRVWRKCKMYGVTFGPGTDWRVSYDACGAFTIDPEDAMRHHLYGEVYRRVRGLREKPPEEQLPGQMSMDDLD